MSFPRFHINRSSNSSENSRGSLSDSEKYPDESSNSSGSSKGSSLLFGDTAPSRNHIPPATPAIFATFQIIDSPKDTITPATSATPATFPELDKMTKLEREAYQEYFDLMTGPKYAMTCEKAHKETIAILRSRQIREFFLSDAYKPKAKKYGFTV